MFRSVRVLKEKTDKITASRQKAARKRALIRGIPLYIMLALPIIWYIVFCYVPMGGLVVAFKDYNEYVGFSSPWATDINGKLDLFKHFKEFLFDDYFWKVFLNTFRVGFFNTLICFPAPIILAVLFNELMNGKFKKIMQTVSYLPYFVSTVAIVNIMAVMLSQTDGVVNQMIASLGFDKINFLLNPNWFIPIYVVLNLWRSVGWGTIIYIASMSNINTELYEAADIEGAGRFRKIWHITLPAIKPTIMILLILALPGILGADFEEILLLQKPQIMSVADVIPTYVYRRGIIEGSADFSTALGMFSAVLNMVIIIAANKISQKVAEVSLF